jgi:hypothetical protein
VDHADNAIAADVARNGRTAIKKTCPLGRSVENTLAFSNGCKAENGGRGSVISAPRNLLGGHRWPDALPVDAKTLRKVIHAEVGEGGEDAA